MIEINNDHIKLPYSLLNDLNYLKDNHFKNIFIKYLNLRTIKTDNVDGVFTSNQYDTVAKLIGVSPSYFRNSLIPQLSTYGLIIKFKKRNKGNKTGFVIVGLNRFLSSRGYKTVKNKKEKREYFAFRSIYQNQFNDFTINQMHLYIYLLQTIKRKNYTIFHKRNILNKSNAEKVVSNHEKLSSINLNNSILISLRTMADKTGNDYTTISKDLKQIEKLGYLTIIRTKSTSEVGYIYLCNEYILSNPERIVEIEEPETISKEIETTFPAKLKVKKPTVKRVDVDVINNFFNSAKVKNQLIEQCIIKTKYYDRKISKNSYNRILNSLITTGNGNLLTDDIIPYIAAKKVEVNKTFARKFSPDIVDEFYFIETPENMLNDYVTEKSIDVNNVKNGVVDFKRLNYTNEKMYNPIIAIEELENPNLYADCIVEDLGYSEEMNNRIADVICG